MTIREAYLKSRELLSALYEEDETRSICKRLFEDVFLIPENALITRADQAFTETAKLETCLQRLLKHEPVQHITGFEYFHGLRIEVSPDVLIPRPETEELVDWVLSSCNPDNVHVIADICTGSGCIALALKRNFPTAEVMATDISDKALQLAQKNEQSNFHERTIQFARHDILNVQWSFSIPDIIVCNPPYIAFQEAGLMAENVLEFEPHQALFVQDDDPLVFYKKIIQAFLPQYPSSIYFELNPLTALELKDFCDKLDLKTEFRKDLQGKIRFARICA